MQFAVTLTGTFIGVGAAQLLTARYDAGRDRETVRALLVEARDDATRVARQLEAVLMILPEVSTELDEQLNDNPVLSIISLEYLVNNELFPQYCSPGAIGHLLNEKQNFETMVWQISRSDRPGEQRVQSMQLMQRELGTLAEALSVEIDYLDGKLPAEAADVKLDDILIYGRLNLDVRSLEITTSTLGGN